MLNHWFTILNHRFTIPNHWFTTLNHWFTIIPPRGINLKCQLSFDMLVFRHGHPALRHRFDGLVWFSLILASPRRCFPAQQPADGWQNQWKSVQPAQSVSELLSPVSECRITIQQFVRSSRTRAYYIELNPKTSYPSYPSDTRVRCRMGRMGRMFSGSPSFICAYAREECRCWFEHCQLYWLKWPWPSYRLCSRCRIWVSDNKNV